LGGEPVILLDTHIWYWWVGESPRLHAKHRELIESHRQEGLGLSIISLWEVAKKNQLGKLELDRPLEEWVDAALKFPNLVLLPLTREIVLDATALPDGFRSDPADELIIATARVLSLPLLTAESKICDYSHVTLLQ
jgi:PIN domain nuclease of toxin-antitoxin system